MSMLYIKYVGVYCVCGNRFITTVDVGEVAGAVNRTTEQQTAGQTTTSDVRPALRDSVTLSATATDKQAALAAKVIKKSASWADMVRG